MAVKTTLVITHGSETIGTIKGQMQKPVSKPHVALAHITKLLEAANGGLRRMSFTAVVDSGDAVKASGTITLASLAAADTITVGSEVFTSSASPSGNNQFLSTGGDTAVATAVTAKINAHPNLAQYVSATSAAAVITVTCTVAGKIGNLVPIAISAHGSVSGSGKLTSGADPATVSATPGTYKLS